MQIRISGRDDRVFALAQDVKDRLGLRPDTRNIGDDWGPRVNKLVVDVSQDRARRAGITSADVATSLQAFLSGYEATQYRERTKTIPVVLRSVGEGRRDVNRLETLDVFSQDEATTVPLMQVAEIDLEWEASEVRRRNRSRTVTVDADLIEGVTAFDVITDIQPWLDEQAKTWGVGYAYEFGADFCFCLSAGHLDKMAMFSYCVAAFCRRNFPRNGGMPEWTNGTVSKTVEPQGSVGSNPTPSAIFEKSPDLG